MTTNILAIESSTSVCSVSLIAADKQFNRLLIDKEKPASLLLTLIDSIFTEANITASELDYIVYSKGPGAFTNIRLGLGVSVGLALAHNIPTFAFCSLAVLAYGAKADADYLLPALDARMAEVYWANIIKQKTHKIALDKPDKLPKFHHRYLGLGSGWDQYHSILSKTTGIKNYLLGRYPEAKYLARLAMYYQKHGLLYGEPNINAFYLRDQVAHIPKKNKNR